jgi:hypothetical protein
MALFRTSLFTVRAGGEDLNVGPGLSSRPCEIAADREVDRARAHGRNIAIAQLMQGVDLT